MILLFLEFLACQTEKKKHLASSIGTSVIFLASLLIILYNYITFYSFLFLFLTFLNLAYITYFLLPLL